MSTSTPELAPATDPTSIPTPSAGTAAPTRTMVRATDVTKAYSAGRRQVEILHGISMEVPSGQMCAVMGPSGSGKSTLLYCLAGLEDPSTGSVELLGRPTASLGRAQRARMRRSDVGFVFQSYNLVPTLTAYENVALPYRLSRKTPPKELIESTLAAVGLDQLAHSRPTVMSGGEQQRVALARVLAQDPRIVFADEPTGALDTVTGATVLEELVRIAHDPERCVVMVTHDPVVASHCDRVLFLRDGYLVAELQQPSAEQVAEVLTGLDASKAL